MQSEEKVRHVISSPVLSTLSSAAKSGVLNSFSSGAPLVKKKKKKKVHLENMIRDDPYNLVEDNASSFANLTHDGFAITIDSDHQEDKKNVVESYAAEEQVALEASGKTFLPFKFGRRLKQSNVSIALESYDDIFSDFDPRHFCERLISKDFISECRRRVTNSRQGLSDNFTFHLLVPENLHNVELDQIITKRMLAYFEYKYKKSLWDLIWFLTKSIAMMVLGIVLLTAAAVANQLISSKIGKWYSIIDQLVQPAAWFWVWSGLDLMFLRTSDSGKISEKKFWNKMRKCSIHFTSYDNGNSS